MLPRVSDYMDTVVHTLSPDDDILHAVRFLLRRHVTGAPVINSKREVVGIVTEKDCLRLLAQGDDDKDRPKGKVADYMTKEVRTVPPDMDVYFVAGMFLNDFVRRFPVVDEGKLVGAITRFDVLRAIETHM